MFTKIWNFITGSSKPTHTNEVWGGHITNGGNMYTIKSYFNGFAIVDRNNTVVAGPYSRERDAKRGAARRGLVVA